MFSCFRSVYYTIVQTHWCVNASISRCPFLLRASLRTAVCLFLCMSVSSKAGYEKKHCFPVTWTLTYDHDLRHWTRQGQGKPPCQIFGSKVICFHSCRANTYIIERLVLNEDIKPKMSPVYTRRTTPNQTLTLNLTLNLNPTPNLTILTLTLLTLK